MDAYVAMIHYAIQKASSAPLSRPPFPQLGTCPLKDYLIVGETPDARTSLLTSDEIILKILHYFLRWNGTIDLGARVLKDTIVRSKSSVTRSNFWENATRLPICAEDHGNSMIELLKRTFLQENTVLAGRDRYQKNKKLKENHDYQLLHLLIPTPRYLDYIRSLHLEVDWLYLEFNVQFSQYKTELVKDPYFRDLRSQQRKKTKNRAALLLLACPNLEHVVLPIEDVKPNEYEDKCYADFQALEICAAQKSGLDSVLFEHPVLKIVSLDYVDPVGLGERTDTGRWKETSEANKSWMPFYYRKMFKGTGVKFRFFWEGTEYLIYPADDEDMLWRGGIVGSEDT